MPPRNHAGKRGSTGGSCNTTESDVHEFQRQQKALLNFETRNEEGQAQQALRLVAFSEAITGASPPRGKAMNDSSSLGGVSSLNTVHTSSVILVDGEKSEAGGSKDFITLEKAASGAEAQQKGHPAVKLLEEKARKPSGPPAQHYIGTPSPSVQASPRGGPRGGQVRQVAGVRQGAPKEDGAATSSSEGEVGDPEGQRTPESDGERGAPPPGLTDSCGTYDLSLWINLANGQQVQPPQHPPPVQGPQNLGSSLAAPAAPQPPQGFPVVPQLGTPAPLAAAAQPQAQNLAWQQPPGYQSPFSYLQQPAAPHQVPDFLQQQ